MGEIIRNLRRGKLRTAGFAEFEAEALKIVPIKSTPYWKAMIRQRNQEYSDWRRAGKTEAAWLQHIIETYRRNSWFKRDWAGTPLADPFAMLRQAEDAHKARFPAYNSPWQKRSRRLSSAEFREKARRTIKDQRSKS